MALLAGEQVWPQHVAGARGQDPKRGEPDDGGAKRGTEARVAERRQQLLPAHGPRPKRRGNQHESQEQPRGIGGLHFRPDVAEVRVTQEPPQQPDGDQ